MLDLLARNYAVVRAGEGQVCGRPTTVIEARRPDGTAAGRFHIDKATGLMLRRELLDQQGREVNLTFFTEIRPVRAEGAVRDHGDAEDGRDRVGA